jgi:hypothetical protein
LTFQLAGPDASRLAADRTPYLVHVLAARLDGDETTVLAASDGRLDPDTPVHDATAEFDGPPLGRYRLLGSVVLPDYNILAVTVGPRLRVVP